MRRTVRAAALVALLGLAAAALAAPGPESRMTTATGNVSKLQATNRTVYVKLTDGNETRFVWTADTRINGTLAVGARVTVRFTTLPDGQNLAHQISVGR
jgi:hypothetical protein